MREGKNAPLRVLRRGRLLVAGLDVRPKLGPSKRRRLAVSCVVRLGRACMHVLPLFRVGERRQVCVSLG